MVNSLIVNRLQFVKHILDFNFAAGTSRGVLHQKPSWIIKLFNHSQPHVAGYGECSIIPGLSVDNEAEIVPCLRQISKDLENDQPVNWQLVSQLPSVRFGLETAIADFRNQGQRILFPSTFTQGEAGIPISGLIWMGDAAFMRKQITIKLNAGFNCLKLKIGALNFDDELTILREIRKSFSCNVLELRVDANGAFNQADVFNKLERLSHFQLHSIEQPVKAGQWELMKSVCRQSPFSVALDEELIGVNDVQKMAEMLQFIQPQYIILKPGLLGGFSISDEWIRLAESQQIGWWITSALEGNIGLNAIAQYTFVKGNSMHQGLGTGQLFSNNIDSPLTIKGGALFYDPELPWGQFPL
jgi:L-alanine-DL-glutamate epimerase-like enolase superfamily enzyme